MTIASYRTLVGCRRLSSCGGFHPEHSLCLIDNPAGRELLSSSAAGMSSTRGQHAFVAVVGTIWEALLPSLTQRRR